MASPILSLGVDNRLRPLCREAGFVFVQKMPDPASRMLITGAMHSLRSHVCFPSGLPTIRKLGARCRIGVSLAEARTSRERCWFVVLYQLSPNCSCTFGYMFGYRHQFGLFTFDSSKYLIRGHLGR